MTLLFDDLGFTFFQTNKLVNKKNRTRFDTLLKFVNLAPALRRLTAISFLLLLLFNIAGYRILFYYAGEQSTAQLIATVEQETYQAEELMTLTVPLSLPYQTDWDDWEKVRGEIEVDGIKYQYVQRKVEGGQMVLQCLPNKAANKIESARDRFFSLANSFQADEGGKKSADGTIKFSKPALSDFDDRWNTAWSVAQLQLSLLKHIAIQKVNLTNCTLSLPVQPPEVAA